MKEKKKIPWGLIYVGLTVVVMIVFGLVNTEFAGMFSVIANLSLGFVALAVLMTGVFLVTEGGIIHMLLDLFYNIADKFLTLALTKCNLLNQIIIYIRFKILQ